MSLWSKVLEDFVAAGATECDTWTHVDTGNELEKQMAAVQQEGVNAPTVCDRSLSPCHLNVGSGMRRQTYELKQANTQIQCDSCDITLVITVFSPSGAALMELCCLGTRVKQGKELQHMIHTKRIRCGPRLRLLCAHFCFNATFY